MSKEYLLKSKNDVLHVIPQFSKMIATQFNTQVKVFHSNNVCEFVNQSFIYKKWNPPPDNVYIHATIERHSKAYKLPHSRGGLGFMLYYACSKMFLS